MRDLTDETLRGLLAAIDAGDHGAVPFAADRLEDLGLLRESYALRVVLDGPASDGRRLLYAEVAERLGDGARAEFIRVQVTTPGMEALTPTRFWEWFGATFLDAFPGSPAVGVAPAKDDGVGCEVGYFSDRMRERYPHWNLTIRRGFVASVQCPLAAWEAHGPLLVSRHPVERVGVACGDLTVRQYGRYTHENDKPWGVSLRHPGIEDRPFGRWLIDGFVARGWRWWHATEADARDALSRELLAWARAEADEKELMPC